MTRRETVAKYLREEKRERACDDISWEVERDWLDGRDRGEFEVRVFLNFEPGTSNLEACASRARG